MLTYSYFAVTDDDFITRAKLMHYIDGKGKNLKLKSNRNYLTNHIRSISRH